MNPLHENFEVGQRWISHSELQLGLGTVLAVEPRSVRIVFLATAETRTYAKASAPLSRVRFAEGDIVRSHEGWSLRIELIQDDGGVLTYHGRRSDGSTASLPESQLDNFMQFSRPADRLFTGQIDRPKFFRLRRATRQHLTRLAQSELYGLAGTRTSLIPHQLYIADEVSRRHAPRVLLADEVGLGKTIEAGLILHRQLLSGRAQRVLIVVPETLVHQWLVEMLRRFNLSFSIFDEERCAAIDAEDAQVNPFETEQLILCALSLFTTQPKRLTQAIVADWDLLVVDEAHHLQWSPGEVSSDYQCVEQLAQVTKGVLLLTATPEQLGKTGHFARLRLLDPDRFPSFEQFVDEEQHYAPIAAAVDNLFAATALTPESRRVLRETVVEGDNQRYLDILDTATTSDEEQQFARERLIEHLLDRHGTGRVLFRNTRQAIQGFPPRQVIAYPLPLPGEYAEGLASFQNIASTEPQWLLSPERLYQLEGEATRVHWTKIDPRVSWLCEHLQSIKSHKALVICSNAATALELATQLKQRIGMQAAVFHEGLSIVERDRAAAFFASTEQGAPVMICSEIGSEGRNFQFAHHLILFDLPFNPDLLEQRIGRLDRIGQTRAIQIHVPYFKDSAQAIMFHWYHEGLQAFEHTCPAGTSVFNVVRENLLEALHQFEEGLVDLANLLTTTQTLFQQFNHDLQQGRDRLLEYNSCRPARAAQLVERAIVETDEKVIAKYLDEVFDNLGIESEIHSATSLVIHPGDHVRVTLPDLDEDGMTVTYHRPTALANEDMQYLSWEHPLIITAMDSVSSSEMGNTAVVGIKHPTLQDGTLLLECWYVLESAASKRLNTARFLPAAEIRVLLDQNGRRLETQLNNDWLEQVQQEIKQDIAKRVIQSQQALLKGLLSASDKVAVQTVPAMLAAAQQGIRLEYQREIDRLLALQKINRTIRQTEIEHLRDEQEQLLAQLEATVAQLDAARVIVIVG